MLSYINKIKVSLIIVTIILFYNLILAQEEYNNIYAHNKSKLYDNSYNENFCKRYITLPSFPGGSDSLLRYIKNNLIYPDDAIKNKIEGIVKVEFDVNIDGTIAEVEVTQSLGYGCDEEAERLIKNMPNWVPAHADGIVSKMRTAVEVSFVLSDIGIKSKINTNNFTPDTAKSLIKAEFGEGHDKLLKYFNDSIGKVNNIKWIKNSCFVLIKFNINKNGNVGDIVNISNKCQDMEVFITALIKKMPKWKAAIKNNDNVVSTISLFFSYEKDLLKIERF